eukprot:g390.t1
MDLSYCLAGAIFDWKVDSSHVLQWLQQLQLDQKICISFSMTSWSRLRQEVTSNCNKYCYSGNDPKAAAQKCATNSQYARVFNNRDASFCYEAATDMVMRAFGHFLINAKRGGTGGDTTDKRGGGDFLLVCPDKELSRRSNCDVETSEEEIQRVIDSATTKAKLCQAWPTTCKKADAFFKKYSVEKYCPRLVHQQTAWASRRWVDTGCADIPRSQ